MIAKHIDDILKSPSNGVIRKMFEEGAMLKKQFGEDKVYDFSLGNPDLDPPKEVLKAIKKYSKEKTQGCHGYMSNAGYQSAREAMAAKTKKEQGIDVPWQNVVMACGAGSALNITMKALLNAGDEVIVPCPYFTEYDHYIHNHNGEIVRVKTKEDFSLDAQAIKDALTEKTAAVLINSPNNPTGRIYSDDEVKALADVLKEWGDKTGRYPYIISDEL